MKLKFKNIFLIGFLAIASVFGAFSAVIATEKANDTPVMEKAEAARATTLYCEMTQSWWTTGNACVGLYYWKSSNTSDNNTWPGTKMTSLGNGKWSGTLPSGYDKVIFTRISAEGADWGAKTKDQTVPTDGTNYCTITTTSAVWGDPGCDTAWTVKKDKTPAASTNQFYVYDPHNNLSGTPKVYGFDNSQKNLLPEWPGVSTGITSTTVGITPMYSVALSTSYPSFIMNNGDANQTVDLTISGNTGKVLVVENTTDNDGHYYTHWDEASKYNGSGNYPTNGEGYYIVKSGNSYTFTGSTKMSTTSLPSGYDAMLTSFSASKDQGIKVRGFYNDREDPNIWSFYNGDTEAFGSADGDGNFVFTKNIVVDIYAKYISGELKFYVLEHVSDTGYYVLGDENFATDHGSSETPWTFASGLKMNSLSGEGNRASYVLTVSKTVEIRLRECLSVDHGWLNFGETYDGSSGITTDGDNVQLAGGGTYTLYVNSEGSAYVLRGIPCDAFCTTFLDTIDSVCDPTGETTFSDLSAAWSTLSDLWDNVISGATGKDMITDIGFNGGSDADDPHRVVLAYHYIVTKYGTSKTEDFIWGQTIPGRRAISPIGLGLFGNDDNNVTTIIIVVASSVALLSVTALSILVIKKRKHKEQE